MFLHVVLLAPPVEIYPIYPTKFLDENILSLTKAPLSPIALSGCWFFSAASSSPRVFTELCRTRVSPSLSLPSVTHGSGGRGSQRGSGSGSGGVWRSLLSLSLSLLSAAAAPAMVAWGSACGHRHGVGVVDAWTVAAAAARGHAGASWAGPDSFFIMFSKNILIYVI